MMKCVPWTMIKELTDSKLYVGGVYCCVCVCVWVGGGGEVSLYIFRMW